MRHQLFLEALDLSYLHVLRLEKQSVGHVGLTIVLYMERIMEELLLDFHRYYSRRLLSSASYFLTGSSTVWID